MNIGILHISDLHISSKTCDSIDEIVKKLIKDVKKSKQIIHLKLIIYVLLEI